jgi:D-amino-acid oxidase
MSRRVTVVGAGISGLSCALLLSEAGYDVEVVASRPPARTTSAVAAALWYPYRALPQREVTRWAAMTYDVLSRLATEPGTGVALRRGRELFREPTPDPWWRDAVPSLERVAPEALPPGYADGLALTAPVVDTSVHLPWLIGRLRARGVRVRTATLARLEDAAPGADIVVNCAGLGARELAQDGELVPVRGQVVVVEQVGLTEWLLAQSDPAALTYVVPRERTAVLGGTADVGSESTDVDEQTAQAIVRRSIELVPELGQARVLGHAAGLRPARSAVRLEAGRLPSGQRVVHDYGHGGAGVTLSYGCAQDVVALVASAALP